MKAGDRNTCLCKLHENMRFKVEKLHQLKLIETKNPETVSECVVCDMKHKPCAYGNCSRCKSKEIPLTTHEIREPGNQATAYSWVNRTEEIEKDGKTVKVSKTIQEEQQLTVGQLITDTTEQLKKKFTRHVFNIRHQFNSLKWLKDTIDETEAVLHVDFSENYNCKLAEEIQAMHFGGSRSQASLHTAVLYTKDTVKSFCTISESTNHSPQGIWAHMDPVLQQIRTTMPEVKCMHFISDGPTTQYRSKNNFYLFNKLIHSKYGFSRSTWNFTEAGHGKGAADGVGKLSKELQTVSWQRVQISKMQRICSSMSVKRLAM